MKTVRLDSLREGSRFWVVGKYGTLISKSASCTVRYDGCDTCTIAAGTMVQVIGIQILVYHDRAFAASGRKPAMHLNPDAEPKWFYIGEGSPLCPDRAAAQKTIGAKKKLQEGWEGAWLRGALASGVKDVVEAVDEIVAALDGDVVKLACYCGDKEGCHGHEVARIVMERRVWKLMEGMTEDE